MYGMRPGWMQQMGEMMGAAPMTPGAGMPPHSNAPFDVMQRPQGGQPLGPPPPVRMPQQQPQQPMGMGQMGMLQAMLGQQTRRPPGPMAPPTGSPAGDTGGVMGGNMPGAPAGGQDDIIAWLTRAFPGFWGT